MESLTLTVALAELQSVAETVADALSQEEALAVAREEGVGLTVEEAHTLFDTVLEGLGDALAVSETLEDGVALRTGVEDTDKVPMPDRDALGVSEGLELSEGVKLGADEVLAVPETLGEELPDPCGEGENEEETQEEALGEKKAVAEALVDGVSATETEAQDGEAVRVAMEPVCEAEALGDAVGDLIPVKLTEGLPDGLEKEVHVTLPE